MILGTILIYIIDPTGKASLIFTGVGFAFLALVSLSFAYYIHNKQSTSSTDTKETETPNGEHGVEGQNLIDKSDSAKRKKMIKGFITCTVSALFGTAGGVLLTQSIQGKFTYYKGSKFR